MTFGERLYQLRKERKISQEELAEQLNVSRQSVSRWENGTASPDFDKTVRLSEIFGVTTDYLIKGEDPLPTSPAEPPKEIPSWRKVLSAVFLVLGGLSLIYGLLNGGYLDYYLLVPLPLILCGLFCLFSKKHTLLKCTWAIYYCSTNYLYVALSWTWNQAFLIFRKIPDQLQRYILPGWILLIALVVLLLYTARSFRKIPIRNHKKHLIITCIFPVIYLVQEILYNVWSNRVLTAHLALIHGGAFYLINILVQTLRLALITGFATYLARWFHRKQT